MAGNEDKIPQSRKCQLSITDYVYNHFFAVDDRPEEKYFNRHVRRQLCATTTQTWKDLGLELLGEGINTELGVIDNTDSDVMIRCTKMFHLWLEREPTASWRKLIQALKRLDLISLATGIESKLTGLLLEPITGLLFIYPSKQIGMGKTRQLGTWRSRDI